MQSNKPANTNVSADSEHRVTMSRKRTLEEDKPALHLVLEPPSVPAKKPRLGAHPCVHVDARNCVLGSVNGTTCNI